ncbi:hypothetical protein [Streptosporangium sp. NPDC051022]|uniref:hypothetical protein n=1 Tax=Streptosporangium sp. NPDC051022 TaxID=3155752 RepID=UPI0034228A32
MESAGSGVGSPIGRLEEVPLRHVWAHEARDFTPWLWDNPGELGRVLRMDLEWKRKEYPIGDYFADLVGTDRSTGNTVVVENQLEPGNHRHLGQLLTYTTGVSVDCVTGVWVAERFRPEHLDTINLLNRLMGPGRQFFAVKVGAWRIGQSSPAPDFRIRAHPQGWEELLPHKRKRRRPASGSLLE